jgi:hypothetical protein
MIVTKGYGGGNLLVTKGMGELLSVFLIELDPDHIALSVPLERIFSMPVYAREAYAESAFRTSLTNNPFRFSLADFLSRNALTSSEGLPVNASTVDRTSEEPADTIIVASDGVSRVSTLESAPRLSVTESMGRSANTDPIDRIFGGTDGD